MHAMDLEVARNFLIAISIGALIGIEREKKKDAEPRHSLGGIRTHILLALLGSASAWMGRELAMNWIFVVTLAAVGAAVVASHLNHQEEAPGLTSEFAALATCLLSGMVVIGDQALAVALAIATSAALAFKQPLHGLVDKIGTADIYAGIKLLIASFIVLPLLPDRTIDPWQAINPHSLWLLVILISGPVAGWLRGGALDRDHTRHRPDRRCRRTGVIHGNHPELRPRQPRAAGRRRGL